MITFDIRQLHADLTDKDVNIRKDIFVFSSDTGRLHPETYCFIEKAGKH